MKKILAIMLALAMIMALAACGSSGSPSSKTSTEPTKTEEKKDETAEESFKIPVTVGDKTFDMKDVGEHYKLGYAYCHEWEIAGYNETLNLYYGSPENPDFVITLIFYDGESVSSAVSVLAGDSTVVKKDFNGTTWTTFPVTSEGKTSYIYVTDINGGAYMAVFQSEQDTTELQQTFMEHAQFK